MSCIGEQLEGAWKPTLRSINVGIPECPYCGGEMSVGEIKIKNWWSTNKYVALDVVFVCRGEHANSYEGGARVAVSCKAKTADLFPLEGRR